MNSETTNTTNIVIMGGGYGGVMTALRVAGKTKKENTNVTLINALEHFVERPRLHESATGVSMQRKSIRHLLRGTKAQFMLGWITDMDPIQQTVSVKTSEGEERLPYDYLVNALGSHTRRDVVPGVNDHAFTLDPYGDLTTEALKSKLMGYHERPFRLVVVGGGATGIEVVTQIKALYPHCEASIVTQGEAGAFKGPKVQAHIQEALAEQSIEVHEHCHVVRVEADRVILDEGHLPADIIVWAGGFIASPIARKAGIQVNKRNQVLVDPYLRSLSHPTLYAVGDVVFPVEEPGAPIRMSLFTALVSGAQAADNIAATIQQRTLHPLSFAWYGQGIALGPHDAVGFSTYPADQASGPIFRRTPAVKVRNFFVWFLSTVLEMERRWPGSFFWNGKQRYAKLYDRESI